MGAVLGLDSDFYFTFLIGVIIVIVAVLAAVPVVRFYLKKEDGGQAGTENDAGVRIIENDARENIEPSDGKDGANDRILNFITAVAFIGIIAAIAVMALYNLQQKQKISDQLKEIENKNRIEITDEDAESDLRDPTKNVPSGFSADSLFPRTLQERPNRPPDPGPPPAVSRDSIIAAGPILKTDPYQVFVSESNKTSFFSVRNDGNLNLEFSLKPSSPNISVSPASGVVKPAQTLKITVSASAPGMIDVTSNHLHDVVEVYYAD